MIVGRRKVVILLDEAANLVGLDTSYLIPIARYIVSHMLEVNNIEFYINRHIPPINLEPIIIKLQGLVRGFLARRKLLDKHGK